MPEELRRFTVALVPSVGNLKTHHQQLNLGQRKQARELFFATEKGAGLNWAYYYYSS